MLALEVCKYVEFAIPGVDDPGGIITAELGGGTFEGLKVLGAIVLDPVEG